MYVSDVLKWLALVAALATIFIIMLAALLTYYAHYARIGY